MFTTPTAMRAMMAVGGRRREVPAALPAGLLGRRAAQSRGDPLVPRRVRHHRSRLLRAHRVLSALRQLPVHGGPRGLDGQADAGLGRRDPRRGRAACRPGREGRDLPTRPLEPALSARLLAERRSREGDLRRRLVPLEGRGFGGRGRLLLVRGPRRRRDHRRRLQDRPVRGRVRLHRASRRSPRPPPSPRPTSVKGNVVKAFIVWRRETSRRKSSRTRSRSSSASASRRTPIRARSSSSTSYRRLSPARSAGSSCGSRKPRLRPSSRRLPTRTPMSSRRVRSISAPAVVGRLVGRVADVSRRLFAFLHGVVGSVLDVL